MERSGKIYQKSAKKKKRKKEEHDQQKRIFMTLENDLLYVLDSAHLPFTVSLSHSHLLSVHPIVIKGPDHFNIQL